MKKNIEGDEHLDYMDETLEQRLSFRAVSLDLRSSMSRHVACFNGSIPVEN